MLNQKDFGWNTERNPVTAEEETCKNYVKAKIIYQIGFTDYQRRDMHVKPTRIFFYLRYIQKQHNPVRKVVIVIIYWDLYLINLQSRDFFHIASTQDPPSDDEVDL